MAPVKKKRRTKPGWQKTAEFPCGETSGGKKRQKKNVANKQTAKQLRKIPTGERNLFPFSQSMLRYNFSTSNDHTLTFPSAVFWDSAITSSMLRATDLKLQATAWNHSPKKNCWRSCEPCSAGRYQPTLQHRFVHFAKRSCNLQFPNVA